jgi:hypothetical protein
MTYIVQICYDKNNLKKQFNKISKLKDVIVAEFSGSSAHVETKTEQIYLYLRTSQLQGQRFDLCYFDEKFLEDNNIKEFLQNLAYYSTDSKQPPLALEI